MSRVGGWGPRGWGAKGSDSWGGGRWQSVAGMLRGSKEVSERRAPRERERREGEDAGRTLVHFSWR